MKTFSTGVNKCGGKCLFWNPTVLVFKFMYLGEKMERMAVELLCLQLDYLGRGNSFGWNFS